MKSASFKKPKLVEQYVKTDLSPKMPSEEMGEDYVVKPNNGRGMGKLRKKKSSGY
jgi:hypothetical protein